MFSNNFNNDWLKSSSMKMIGRNCSALHLVCTFLVQYFLRMKRKRNSWEDDDFVSRAQGTRKMGSG